MLDPGDSLYHRLGGYDAIAAAVDELLPRLVADPQLSVYWKGKCVDSAKKDRQLIVEYFCEATGGPANYIGRDMKTSHEGLGISDSDWAIFVEHTVATLDDLGAPEREKNEFLAIVGTLRADIVGAAHLAVAGR